MKVMITIMKVRIKIKDAIVENQTVLKIIVSAI